MEWENKKKEDNKLHYFIRYTEDADADMKRGTVLHKTEADDLKTFRELFGHLAKFEIKNGIYYQVLDGLCGYSYGDDVTTIADLKAKMKKTRRYKQTRSVTVHPVIFQGKLIAKRYYGDLFTPVAIMKILKRLKTVEEKLINAFGKDAMSRIEINEDEDHENEAGIWLDGNCVGTITAYQDDSYFDVLNSTRKIKFVT